MASRYMGLGLSALLLSSCLFETDGGSKVEPQTFRISPDLAIGNQWMYRFREYVEYEDGTKGDTTGHFIHYEITGDSVIDGIKYRILVEEDLAMYNTDVGLIKSGSTYAILSDSRGVEVKVPKSSGPSSGRLPIKTTASSLDTSLFWDEFTALKLPLVAGTSWVMREKGNPYGILPARKTFLGEETLNRTGQSVPALKFQVEVEGLDYIRTYEWYAGDLKIFSRSSSSNTYQGKDSVRVEEEFLEKRDFTKADTQSVLKGTIFEGQFD